MSRLLDEIKNLTSCTPHVSGNAKAHYRRQILIEVEGAETRSRALTVLVRLASASGHAFLFSDSAIMCSVYVRPHDWLDPRSICLFVEERKKKNVSENNGRASVASDASALVEGKILRNPHLLTQFFRAFSCIRFASAIPMVCDAASISPCVSSELNDNTTCRHLPQLCRLRSSPSNPSRPSFLCSTESSSSGSNPRL